MEFSGNIHKHKKECDPRFSCTGATQTGAQTRMWLVCQTPTIRPLTYSKTLSTPVHIGATTIIKKQTYKQKKLGHMFVEIYEYSPLFNL